MNKRNRRKQSKLVRLCYAPPGQKDEIAVYLDAKKFPSGKHHDRPSSRRGQTTITIDPVIHWAWHVLIGNDFVEEVIAKILHAWLDEQGRIKEYYLVGKIKEDEKGTIYDERYLAWYIIFGDCRDPNEAIKIIKEIFVKRT